MGRRFYARRRRHWAALIVVAELLAAPDARAAADACVGGDCACADSCTSGDCGTCVDGFCSNLVTPLGGCASGFEMFWFRADYMLSNRSGIDLPPLVTSSPVGTPDAEQARLGFDDTSILAGGDTVSDGVRSGYRIEGGFWLDPQTGWGMAFDFFNAGRDSYGFAFGPNDGRILGRPFIDAQANEQSARIIDAPGELSGVISGLVFDDFQGAGGWMQRCIWTRGSACTPAGGAQLSVLGGYRYYHHDSLVFLHEDYSVVDGSGFNPPLPNGQVHFGNEQFVGRNEFHGAEIGLQGRMQRARWWCEGLAAVAIGGSQRDIFINGVSRFQNPMDDLVDELGVLLTSPNTNLGRYSDDEFQAVPRFRLGVGWQFNEWLGLRAGYNLVIWDVSQAADHLPPNLEVDPRNLPTIQPGGGPEPLFPGILETTMVAHGLDLGLELSF